MNFPPFIWIFGIPLLAAPLVYLSGHLPGNRGKARFAQFVSLIALAAACVQFYYAARELQTPARATYIFGGISLCPDGIGLLLAAIALGLGLLVVLFSSPYISSERGQEKFYAMLLGMIGVMIGMGFTHDLFNLWIWFEAMAITSYLLVAFYQEQPLSLEAGVKYLVQSAAGSVLVLLAIGLVFSQTGALNLDEIKEVSNASSTLLAAGVLFVIGFGVKVAIVPLHTWLPDAHSQAPSGISAMLSGVVIEAGLIALLRALSALSGITSYWGPLLIGLGILNMVFGNLMAVRQVHVKRLLAYSSLTHVGYMLVGLGIAIYAGRLLGAQGGFFHMFNHGLMKGLAFLSAGGFLYALHIAVGNHKPLTIDDLSGASHRYPELAFSFSLAVLALGAIPPLAGFMSEWQILTAGFETKDILIIGLMILVALNSVFSLVYYAGLVNVLYRCQTSGLVRSGKKIPVVMIIPIIILTLAVITLGIWPSLMNWLTIPAGLDLLSAFTG